MTIVIPVDSQEQNTGSTVLDACWNSATFLILKIYPVKTSV